MNVLLLQLDGKLPNLALMRVAAHHRVLGDTITFRRVGSTVQPEINDPPFARVYASLIFERSRPLALQVAQQYPQAIIGGTGWNITGTLEQIGITTTECDYSIYPQYRQSLGFTQRGCRLKCPFCVVPTKEGAVQAAQTIDEIWRGDPWPREVLLLDNDFFGQPHWQQRIAEIRNGQFRVSFNQGINVRTLNDEQAAAIAAVHYRDGKMTRKCLYCAWDNAKDEARLFRGLELLVKHGVKPGHIMVYMLVGYWPGETPEQREYRRQKLRDFGCDPYPMPYVRTRELIGFQRWVVGAYDKKISWQEWKAAQFQPTKLAFPTIQRSLWA